MLTFKGLRRQGINDYDSGGPHKNSKTSVYVCAHEVCAKYRKMLVLISLAVMRCRRIASGCSFQARKSNKNKKKPASWDYKLVISLRMLIYPLILFSDIPNMHNKMSSSVSESKTFFSIAQAMGDLNGR